MLYNIKNKIKLMKKIILAILFLTLGMSIKATEVKINTNVYFHKHVIKSTFDNNFIDTKWIKLDSTKLVLDLSNKKIYINDEYNVQVYKLNKSKTKEYDNSLFYTINAHDTYNNKYKIEVIYYKDNSGVVVSIINDYKIDRYLIKK